MGANERKEPVLVFLEEFFLFKQLGKTVDLAPVPGGFAEGLLDFVPGTGGILAQFGRIPARRLRDDVDHQFEEADFPGLLYPRNEGCHGVVFVVQLGVDPVQYGVEPLGNHRLVDLLLLHHEPVLEDVQLLLVPAQPVPTICRTVVFENQIPMEVGISYGDGYWRGK